MKLNVFINQITVNGQTAFKMWSWHDEVNYIYVTDSLPDAVAHYVKDHAHEKLQFNFIMK